MYRSIYDSDVTVWSPQGRIKQIEYGMEAVKQGSACVAARSDTHVVFAAFKRLETQRKIYKIDDQIGCVISGLNADSRRLSVYMKEQSMQYKFTNEVPIPTSRLVLRVANRAQQRTMEYGKRPFGVGILVGGIDKSGPHLYQTDPSGNFTEYYANTIGARSQATKTYLERHFAKFAKANLDQLIAYSLQALQASNPDEELTSSSCSLAAVGIGMEMVEYNAEEITNYLDKSRSFNADTGAFPE